MIGAEDSLAVTQQLSLQLDGLRDPPAPAEAYGKVAPRDERVGVLGAEHPFPVDQHLTEDLERLVHLIIPAQTGTKVVAGEQGTGMIRTQDALLIAEQLRQDIKRLVQRAGLGEPVSQVVASKQSVGVIRTEDSQLVFEQLRGKIDRLLELPVPAKKRRPPQTSAACSRAGLPAPSGVPAAPTIKGRILQPFGPRGANDQDRGRPGHQIVKQPPVRFA